MPDHGGDQGSAPERRFRVLRGGLRWAVEERGGDGLGLTLLSISPRQRLDDVIKTASTQRLGGTGFPLPMIWTLASKVEADVFVAYTDLETCNT